MRRNLIIASTITALAIPALALAAQWTPAPASPPSNNVTAPINVGSDGQTKSGDFGTNGNFAVSGSSAFSGRITGYGGISAAGSGCCGAQLKITNTDKTAANVAQEYVLYNMSASSGYGNRLAFWQYGGANPCAGGLCASVLNLWDDGRVEATSKMDAPQYCINNSNCITAWPSGGGGTVSGSGSTNSVPKWTNSTTLGDSIISDNGSGVSIGGSVDISNGLTVGNAGGAYTYITMRDDESPNGVKYIHANGNNVGFLSGGGSWLTRWDDAGNQVNTGNITALGNMYAPAYFYSSDRNLKTNIADLSSDASLANVMKLQGVSFDWKKDGTHSVGLIAQDVEKVYPELVATDAKTGLKSVEYGNLVAPLIEAVKAQQKQIDALKAEVQALKNK